MVVGDVDDGADGIGATDCTMRGARTLGGAVGALAAIEESCFDKMLLEPNSCTIPALTHAT